MNPSSNAKRPSLPPIEAATLIDLARENLRLLAELVSRYEVGHVTAPVDDRIVRSPSDVVEFIGAELTDLAQEQLRVVLLDTKNRILGTQLIYQGGLNATVVRLADCFREAVARNAAAVIFCHNHPSGDVRASADDIRLTEEAGKVGNLLGIELLDHVIIGREGWASLRREGCYTPPR
jgi:DNA repair protein RadC